MSFDVYGLGNALVDIQYQVDPDFLQEMSIDKGVMTLIEEDRQEALITNLGGKEMARSSGGSAANTMISVVNCGGTGYYACKVAYDADGDFYLNDLEASGVKSSTSNRSEGTTGKCLVMITEDADRTMNTFLGITSTFGPEQIEQDMIAQSKYIYIEGYLVAGDSGFESAQVAQKMAQDSGVKVSLTLSDPFITSTFMDRMQALVNAGVDMLFCNEDEAKMFTNTDTVEAACAALANRVGGFAVTCGADGARVKDGGDLIHASGFQVDAVDTNGAGDSFAGAYLAAVTNGYTAEQAAKLATYVSSRVVSKYGPRFEDKLSKDDIEGILGM
ncbi:MAG: adenosine kinase [Candidatus Latescibacteria bacterium]|jgi:sugar/nucleoside kinase (ribokinase family)|nr:adenosine kinase [Candidatus Latescibacterota bacterium]MBT4140708.1 adenosine kinase [Candidatus Latescibacterota bacterium]